MMMHFSSGRDGGFGRPPQNRVTKVEATPEGRGSLRVRWEFCDAARASAVGNAFDVRLAARDAAGSEYGYADVATLLEVLPPRDDWPGNVGVGEVLIAIPPTAELLDGADAGASRSRLDRHLRPRTVAVILEVRVTDRAAPYAYSKASGTWEHALEDEEGIMSATGHDGATLPTAQMTQEGQVAQGQ